MNYKLISNAEDIAAAFAQFARALGVPDHGNRARHDGFSAKYQLRGRPGRERTCVELKWFGPHKGTVLISVCPDVPLATAGLIVVDGHERKYLSHSDHFAPNTLRRGLFRQNTKGDSRWINAAGDKKKRYLVTPLDEIDDADIVKEVASYLTKRFVPNSSEDEPVVRSFPSSKPPTELNRILHGPPGTSKTYDAISEAVKTIDGAHHYQDRIQLTDRLNELRDEGRVDFVTFHQNYTYEDFIEGIRPVLDKGTKELRYELRDGIFKQIAERARECADDNYVLVIDEVNRGNIAKIFGELITLIEPSKRLGSADEARATLPYSQERFSVPANLYLIGTMNTADRGIALLDVALRRRFEFVERMPNPDHWGIAEDIEGVNGRLLLRAINGRIVEELDREHQIGHTYFMDIQTLEDLKRAFQAQVIPLLQEYFYDDWEKMRRVLNSNPFVTERDGAERSVFDVLPPNDGRWLHAESYKRIYEDNSGSGSDEDP